MTLVTESEPRTKTETLGIKLMLRTASQLLGASRETPHLELESRDAGGGKGHERPLGQMGKRRLEIICSQFLLTSETT